LVTLTQVLNFIPTISSSLHTGHSGSYAFFKSIMKVIPWSQPNTAEKATPLFDVPEPISKAKPMLKKAPLGNGVRAALHPHGTTLKSKKVFLEWSLVPFLSTKDSFSRGNFIQLPFLSFFISRHLPISPSSQSHSSLSQSHLFSTF